MQCQRLLARSVFTPYHLIFKLEEIHFFDRATIRTFTTTCSQQISVILGLYTGVLGYSNRR